MPNSLIAFITTGLVGGMLSWLLSKINARQLREARVEIIQTAREQGFTAFECQDFDEYTEMMDKPREQTYGRV